MTSERTTAPTGASQIITSNGIIAQSNLAHSPDLVLQLRGATTNGRKVKWDEDVVDNETLGKKKSKSKSSTFSRRNWTFPSPPPPLNI